MTREPFLLLFILFLFGCGGGSGSGSTPTPPTPTPAAVAGKWEFVAISTANPTAAWPDNLVEANLSQTDTAVSAGTAATALFPFYANGTNWGVENPTINVCGGTGETISATVNGNTFSFTMSETGPDGTYKVTGTVTVNTNGQLMTGTYTSAAACGLPNDAGNVTGTLIGSMSGNYTVTFVDGTILTVSVTEDLLHNITITGTDQGQAFTLTGEAIGGSVNVSGDIPSIGQDTFVGAELTSQLVTMLPAVGNLTTKQGDFLFMDFNGNIALVQPQ